MKKILKRVFAGMLAFLCVATTLGTEAGQVSAASSSANLKLWYASTKPHEVITEFNSYTYTGNIMYAMLDGESAYCLNYAGSADGGQKMTSSKTPRTDLSSKQEKQLAYCLYYGFGTTEEDSPTNAERNKFIATQTLVWIIEKNLFGTDEADSAAKKLCACAPDSSAAYEYYKTVRGKIQGSMNVKIPSFASKTKSDAETYELEWNDVKQRYEITLTDSNSALSNFDFSASGYSVERNGSKLTIYTEEADSSATVVKGVENNDAVNLTSGCLYWCVDKEKYQEFVSTKPQAEAVCAYFKVKTESVGYVKLTKSDAETKVFLADAVYGIYSDSGCTKLVSKLTTNVKGTATSEALPAGTYYVKEISAPEGYVLSTKVHTITVKAGKTVDANVTDQEQLGAITIYKKGEVLTGWNGSNFVYESKYLQGAKFKVTAASNIYRADGTKVHSKGDVIAQEITTGSDGKAVLSQLHLGAYIVTETKSVDGYTISTTPKTVTISSENQTAAVQYESVTMENTRQTAKVTVMKKDAETNHTVTGGQYTIYAGNDIKNYKGNVIVKKDTALQTIAIKDGGQANYNLDLPVANSYYIKETQAPLGYVINSDDVYEFSFDYLNQEKTSADFSYTFHNERITAKLSLQKVDGETGSTAQGDSTLAGAVYGLYARTDIVHPDDSDTVLYKADALVTTFETDLQGRADVSELYLGSYYVKEISASQGYLLDETEYDVVFSADNDQDAEISKRITVKEKIKKQAFCLIKISDKVGETEKPLLEGAGFTAYLKSQLSIKENGSYDFENATPVVIGENGETELFTDAAGYLETIPLPYGTYVVVESTTPHNMETVAPFEVKITEHNPDKPQTWRVFLDGAFSAKLRIVKKDADTGRTVLVPNAEFKIYDLDNMRYVTMTTTYPSKVVHTSFFTDEDGDLILPEALDVGNYRIEEVSAPHGYLINDNYIMVAVDTNTFYEIDGETNDAVITVEYEDSAALGELTIVKSGEALTGFSDGIFFANKKFVYKEQTLSGAVFEVYAGENIYTADMQTDSEGNRLMHYAAGDLVKTVVTGEDGSVTLSDIPLGTYRIVEVEAPFGYVLNADEVTVTLAYKDDKTPVVKEKISIGNDRQKVAVTVIKKDAVSGKLLEKSVFGLYAAEDIVSSNGSVIVKADTMIESAVTKTDGKCTFCSDLPLGKYYVKELEAPEGYEMSDSISYIDASSPGKDTQTLFLKLEFTNKPVVKEEKPKDIDTNITGDIDTSDTNIAGDIEPFDSASPKTGEKKEFTGLYLICLAAAAFAFVHLVGRKKAK